MVLSRAASGAEGADDAPAGWEWVFAALLIGTATWALVQLPLVVERAWDDSVMSRDVGRRARVLWVQRESGAVVSGAVWFAISAVIVVGSVRLITFWWLTSLIGLVMVWAARSALLPYDPSIRVGHHPAPSDIDTEMRLLAAERRVVVRHVWVAESARGWQRSVASACGFRRTGTIRLSSALAASNRQVVRAVCAHEIGHLASPVWRRVVVPAALQSVIVVVAWSAVISVSGTVYAGSVYSIPWFALLTTFLMALLGPLFARLQRSEELHADAYGAALVGDAKLFAKVLSVIDRESEDTGIYAHTNFGRSHPPAQQRITALGVSSGSNDSD